MTVRFAAKFRKQYNRADKKIQNVFEDRLKLFLKDSHHPTLNNHHLAGKLQGFRSINITGDWRAIYSVQGKTVIFELFGTHSQLYR